MDSGNQGTGVTLYVSPRGNDGWSGMLAAPAKDASDGPLATLGKALECLRQRRREAPPGTPARIVLRGGLYPQPQPLELGADDAGTPAAPVVVEAYGDEVPVVSGGRLISGWQAQDLDGRAVWVAELPAVRAGTWTFSQLFVDGTRRPRTRLPAQGLYQVAALPDLTPETRYNQGQDCFACRPGDVREWHNLTDVEMVSLNFWIDSHMRLKAFDPATNRVTLDRHSDKRLTDDFALDKLGCYYLENVFEALAEPGQWYLDRPAGKLYYLPRPGECIDTIQAVAPILEQVLVLRGTADKPVAHLRFRGLEFSHTEFAGAPERAAYGQSANAVPAAVQALHATGCVFERCAFTHTGTYGVEFGDGCMDCALRRCTLTDLGAGGVKLWHGSRRGEVSDCVIAAGGQRFLCGVGILIGQSSANNILHNHIHHLYYSGISVGWTWGYGPSSAFGNVIEHNHIHDIGQGLLSDMGGIYCLGVSTGTRVRFNCFHDIRSRGYGGWAIYTDEGSTDILIEKNLAYRTKSASFHQHYGRNNLVQNNILAFSEEAQVARTRIEAHCSFAFRRNVVLFATGRVLSGSWSEVRCEFDGNLYWDRSGRPLDFAGRTLEQWQRLGFDRGSVVADPLFVDPDHGDFRLRPGSPVRAIGFEEFSLADVGPRPA